MKLILSSHIPKTAGRSFLVSLIRIFGDENVLRDYGNLQPEKDGLRKIEENHRCIHGHFSINKYKDHIQDCEWVTWIRNPVERVISSYCYWEREKAGHDGYPHIDIEDFIAMPDAGNLQSRMLRGLNIEDFLFIGISEYYDVMHDKFCEILDVPMVPKVNINHNPLKHSSDKYIVPKHIKRQIKKRNRDDLWLYDMVYHMNKRKGII